MAQQHLKATTIKEALAKFEEEHKKPSSECSEVRLISQYPLIEKMDASLSTLVKCEKLCLSSNRIEKIANLNALKCLKILSLGRNCIKSLTGLEAVGDTLEQLWISYNNIDKMKGISYLKKLQVLYMSNNKVDNFKEVECLGALPCLVELVLIGNPVDDCDFSSPDYKAFQGRVQKVCSSLKKLDGIVLVSDIGAEAQEAA